MAIAALSKIEKTFGQRILFNNMDFNIEKGERVGLIGDNGSGKSTLFKVLTGEIAVDQGTVAIGRNTKLGHLVQDPKFDSGNTVMDEAELAFSNLHDLSHRMRELEHDMAVETGDELDKTLEKYQVVQHEFDLAGGYAWRHRLEATLLGVGLQPDAWEQNVATLSGGQRSRLALAKLLIGDNDLLLLDEPTNHLDLAAIAWLEQYLANYSGAVLIISHDRYLLDRLATRIVWLTQSRLKSYPGNYSSFVEQRKIAELSQARAHEEQQEFIAKQEEYIRRFGANQRARQAAGRKKRLERLVASDALVQAVETNKKIRVSLGTDQRAGDRVLSVKHLAKSYDDKSLWNDVTLEIKRGQRVGIIGPNGSGKTTMLEVLLGRRDADGGEIRWGANLKIGYYDQQLGEFDPENTVEEEVKGDRECSRPELRAVLSTMLFRGEDIFKPISLLSGGERARVALAQLLLDKPNVLVLDEPTNHLDIPSCEALENALKDFNGTIICVSHDRYFLDRTVDHLIVLQPPEAILFTGNFSAWSAEQKRKAAEAQAAKETRRKSAPAPKAAPPPKPPAQRRTDNPWNRPFGKLPLEQLEKQITDTEIEISQCQSEFADPAISRDPKASKELSTRHGKLAEQLKALEAEYFARNG